MNIGDRRFLTSGTRNPYQRLPLGRYMIGDIDPLLEVGVIAFYGIISAILTGAGLFVEYSGLQTFINGDLYLSIYIVGIGTVMLYFAYLVITRKFLQEIQRFHLRIASR